MALVKVIAVDTFQTSRGEAVTPGSPLLLEAAEANRLREQKKVVLNSDFKEEMIAERQVRVKEQPRTAARTTKKRAGIKSENGVKRNDRAND